MKYPTVKQRKFQNFLRLFVQYAETTRSWSGGICRESEGGEDPPKTITLRVGYEVTERTIDKRGQILPVPDIELNTWRTNLGLPDDEIIRLYHAHGECEQYHSEIKTDMDVERRPSGKFFTNKLLLERTVLAYNILRMIGQESLKTKGSPKTKLPIKRRRLRTVVSNLILIAAHAVECGEMLVVALGRSNIWRFAFLEFLELFHRFCPAFLLYHIIVMPKNQVYYAS